jgi:hypothetical protein
MRHAFLNFGNWAKATEYALFASVPRTAIAYQIPLIWWGESAASLLGDMGVLGTDPSDGNRLKYSNTIGGGSVDWLTAAGFERDRILQYCYPTDEEMQRANLRIVFMDYFMREFTSFTNGNFASLRGLNIRQSDPLKEPDIFGTGMLDEDFFNINNYIRYLKFGFGKTSDVITPEIRAGRITREQGIELVKRYDGGYDPLVLERFIKYIDISVEEFWSTVDKYVNVNLFEKISSRVYRPRFEVGVGI